MSMLAPLRALLSGSRPVYAADKPFTTTPFLATGASTARTDPARWADWHNVKEYGAVGNGIIDDTAAIQAAIDWVAVIGSRGTIYFPRGTYKVTQPIILPANLSRLLAGLISFILCGDGEASVITGNVDGFVLDYYDPRGNAGGSFSSVCVIEKLKVVNTNPTINPSSTGGPGAIRLGQNQFTTVRDCVVTGVFGIIWNQNDQYYASFPFSQTCTISIASPAIVGAAAHGLSIGNNIRFTTTGALPTGITEEVNYFVLSQDFTANQFSITADINLPITGAPVNTSGSQSGDQTVSRLATCGPGGIQSNNCSAFNCQVMNVRFDPITPATIISGSCAMAIGNMGVATNCNISYYDMGLCLVGPGDCVLGGQISNCNYGIMCGFDQTGTRAGGGGGFVVRSTKLLNNNVAGLYVLAGGKYTGVNVVGNGGTYGIFSETAFTEFESCVATGTFGTAGIAIEDFAPQHALANPYVTFVGCSSVSWRMPTNAPSAQFINCTCPSAEYAFTTLPNLSVGTPPNYGDEYLVKDTPTATVGNFATVVTVGASSIHNKLRWNGTGWMIV